MLLLVQKIINYGELPYHYSKKIPILIQNRDVYLRKNLKLVRCYLQLRKAPIL